MKKQTEKKPEAKTEIATVEKNESLSVVDEATGEVISLDEILDSLETATEGAEVTADYKKWEVEEDVRCIFLGIEKMNSKFKTDRTDDEGMVEVARFVGIDRKPFICGDVVIVGTMKNHKAPKAFIILCTGEKTSGNGEYFTFKINEAKMNLTK